MNLARGWMLMAVVTVGSPELRETAVEIGRHPVEMGIGAASVASAILGGTVITLMTWMERGAESMPAPGWDQFRGSRESFSPTHDFARVEREKHTSLRRRTPATNKSAQGQ